MELSPFVGTLLGNIVIAIGIIVAILIVKIIKKSLNKYLEYIIAITVGLLLGMIFLGFIPELSHEFEDNGKVMGIFILFGIFLFYILELFLHWHHCKDLGHESKCNHSNINLHESGFLIFGGTFMHNIFHGIVLFSAFAVDINFGIVTTFALLLHSIPQNIVNYIMNHNNIKYAYIAAFGGIFGALLTFPFSGFLIHYKFYFLAIITGGLLYTALADIFPEFKGKGTYSKKLCYLACIIFGIFMFLGFEEITEHNHGHNESETEIHLDK